MTKYAMLLAIAASLRVARKTARPLGCDISSCVRGCGDSAGDAERIESMLAADDAQFQEACSRAAALGEFETHYPRRCGGGK